MPRDEFDPSVEWPPKEGWPLKPPWTPLGPDIVEHLRDAARTLAYGGSVPLLPMLLLEAAREIERLRS